MRGLFGTALLFAVAALGAACENDLPRPTEIARMRVLGARLEVEGDEERVTPRPGERLRVSLPVVFPSPADDTSELQTMMIGCTAPDRYTGSLPICQELVDAALMGQASSPSVQMFQDKLRCGQGVLDDNYVQLGAVSAQCMQGDPVALLPVLPNFRAQGVLFAGVVCERGTPFIDARDPLLFGCDDNNRETLRFHGIASVLHEASDENDNPSLDTLSVQREGMEWPEYVPDELPPEEGCVGVLDGNDPTVPTVIAAELRLDLSYDAEAREESEGQPEDLEFTIYTTYGEMERRFTLFEGTTDGENGVLDDGVKWDPPKKENVPEAGQLVRFFVTLRDQRGGFAMTSRALCVKGTMTPE